MLSFLVWITQMGSLYQYNLSSSFTLTVLSFCVDLLAFVLFTIELRGLVGQDEKIDNSNRVDTQISLV